MFNDIHVAKLRDERAAVYQAHSYAIVLLLRFSTSIHSL